MGLTQEQINAVRSELGMGRLQTQDSQPTGLTVEALRQNAKAVGTGKREKFSVKQFIKGAGKIFAPVGETYGEAVASVTGTTEKIEKANQGMREAGDELFKAALDEKDEERRKRLIQMAEQNYKMAGTTIQDAMPSILKTKKQIAGESLITVLNMFSGGKLTGAEGTAGAIIGQALGGTAKARIATETAKGAAFGLGAGLAEGKEGGDLVQPVAVGSLIGFALSAAGEGIGALRRSAAEKASKVKIPKNVKGKTAAKLRAKAEVQAQRALRVPKKEIVDRLRYGKERVGRIIVDGKYSGNIDDVIGQATKNRDAAGKALGKSLSKYADKTISRDNVRLALSDIIDDPLNEQFKQGFERTLANEMPEVLNVPQANQLKQRIAKSVFGTGRRSVTTEKKKFMFDFWKTLSNQIDDVTGDSAIRAANKNWSDAHTVWGFATDLKGRTEAGTGGKLSLWNAVNKMIEETFGSTRSRLLQAQALETAAEKSPQITGAIAEGVKKTIDKVSAPAKDSGVRSVGKSILERLGTKSNDNRQN